MTNQSIDGGHEFDWGKASRDYARYRDIYPPEFYEKILSMGFCTEGQKILDIGTGTGVIPRNMAKYGARFIGADISENQIKYAEKLTKQSGLDIKYIVSFFIILTPNGFFQKFIHCSRITAIFL